MTEVIPPNPPNPPNPAETGSLGTQKSENNSLLPFDGNSSSVTDLSPIGDKISKLANKNSKSFGGETTTGLIVGSFEHIAYELQQTKSQLEITSAKFEKMQEKYFEAEKKVAVLKERINANKTNRKLGNLVITLGTALIGVAIELYRASYTTQAIIAGLIGVFLMVFGWFSGHGETKE